jgi:hypothetical protein
MWNRPPPLEIRTWWRASPWMLKWSYHLKYVTLNASLELARSAFFCSSSSFPSLCCFDLSLRACACLRTVVLHKRGDRPQQGTCFAHKNSYWRQRRSILHYWWRTKLRKGFLTLMERVGWGFELLVSIRVTFDKGPRTKSPGTNLKQIEPWIGPFFILKETFFSQGTISVSKGLGSNSRIQYQKCAIDMWED